MIPQIKCLRKLQYINPDDFYSQPSGGSGKKIACGQITY